MTSYTATQILTPLNLGATITATIQEGLVDAIIDQLNLWGAPNVALANMAGSTGSKTVTLTSAEKAAVLYGARAIYNSYYNNAKGTTNIGMGALSLGQTDFMSNSTVLATIKAAADQLSNIVVGTDLPIVIGTDTS